MATQRIYKTCKTEIQDLAESGEVFTTLDVVARVSGRSWEKSSYDKALMAANQVLSQQYREGYLVRYGPVNPPIPNAGEDYVRYGTQIVYAGEEKGPTELETPNGTFQRLSHETDHIRHVGRRVGTQRDDGESWSNQSLNHRADEEELRPLKLRIDELQGQVARLHEENRRKDAEIERLKHQSDESSSEAEKHIIDGLADVIVARMAERMSSVKSED